jgi:7,8-dihydro-6-hydroxymethylpterin-pyrophosphokinase
MEGRGFVLVPLDELVPCLIHPVFKVSIHEMCSQIDRSGIQVYRS